MDKKLLILMRDLLGKKRFEILQILCQKCDENGFVSIKIDELVNELGVSKPTIISTFKMLEEKKLFKRLKNGFYELKIKDEN